MLPGVDFLSNELSKRTAVFGLKLWTLVGIGVGLVIVLILFFLSLWLGSRKKSVKQRMVILHKELPGVGMGRKLILRGMYAGSGRAPSQSGRIPNNFSDDTTASEKDVAQVEGLPHRGESFDKSKKSVETRGKERFAGRPQLHPVNGGLLEMGFKVRPVLMENGELEVERKGDNRRSSASSNSRCADSPSPASAAPGISVPEVSHLGWGHWYTLRELEAATDSFSDANVLGEGGYGIVYFGQLTNGTRIAVKTLLNNRGQAEREFKVEVEAIGRVRHKNLVRLIGYCMEGLQRILVYEYIDNGNLEQWLHGSLGEHPPLTWDIRMKIILGTGKGMAYLHEGLEPKVVHRDVKSSNILLDSQWNPKVSDFGLAKLLAAGNSHVTTRVMGTFGYVAPEYALTGMLTEKSDVYSYGVLLMEIVTGRVPVDFNRPPDEVNLVDWLKTMVCDHRIDEVVDPKMGEKPSPRALKRTLLIALRCVDPDAQKRPKMGQIVYMLEAEDNASHEKRKSGGHHEVASVHDKAGSVSIPRELQQDCRDFLKSS